FDEVSGRVWGKYTTANERYFYSKWEVCPAEEGVFIKQIPDYVRPTHPHCHIPLPSIPRTAAADAIRMFPDRA
ncbi:MAG: hypothetical protein VKM17_07175, partial [Cyanobacteriota bacterium]|nr:hypothetical protein [Cyanobacteriota bacterium]